MNSRSFSDQTFHKKVGNAVEHVRKVLDTTRNPIYANQVSHQYADKFELAQFLTASAIAAQYNCFLSLGIDEDSFRRLREWTDANQAVTLRFLSTEQCSFKEKRTREVDALNKRVTRTTKVDLTEEVPMSEEVKEEKLVFTVEEYVWKFDVEYTLLAFRGASPDNEADRIVLKKRASTTDLVTTEKQCPYPQKVQLDGPRQHSVELTWFLKQLEGDTCQPKKSFLIDRSVDKCRTPRRNPDISEAVDSLQTLSIWCNAVYQYIKKLTTRSSNFKSKGPEPSVDQSLTMVSTEGLFVPVVPLFEDIKETSENEAASITGGDESAPMETEGQSSIVDSAEKSVVLSSADMASLLDEQKRSLTTKIAELALVYPAVDTSELLSLAEVQIMVVLLFMRKITEHYVLGVDFIENMLYVQLREAVGKELTSQDVYEYMQTHARNLYAPEYAPKPFCFPIARPQHYPEGTISIETSRMDEPVNTFQREFGTMNGMKFRLNASTSVEFAGGVTLHALLQQNFNHERVPLTVKAHARQFSTYMILLGAMESANTFAPKHACILQNKDILRIPLNLEPMPTPKEFEDSIESLSPEQQRLAQAYRSMQLEGSLAGILVVQLKPQLERLLKLPEDSLTKEIALTQNLLELFIEYQIPSDLLTFDGEEGETAGNKVAAVKQHVQNIMDMIEKEKKAEVEAATQQAQFNRPRMEPDSRGLFGGGAPTEGANPYGYSPTSPVYSPASPAYSPTSPAYCPTSPAYEVASAYAAGTPVVFGGGDAPGPPPPAPGFSFGGSKGLARAKGGAKGGGGKKGGGRGAPPSMLGRESQPQILKQSQQEQRSTAGVAATPMAAEAKSVSHSDGDRWHADGVAMEDDQSGDRVGDHSRGEMEMEMGMEMDVTQIPVMLDQQYKDLDVDAAIRPTKVKFDVPWVYETQKSLLAKRIKSYLAESNLGEYKDKAFDLLDALSRSGTMTLEDTSLHLIVAATHSFDHTLMDVVIKENVNPVEKIERSSLIIASTIQGREAKELIRESKIPRLASYSPMLLTQKKGGDEHQAQ
mmetsp:Transcript_21420/g.25796  ORF Transcript_21420/g.25796 Transcript_21420/m.25796 type:complete len:1044 (-) Transcript_21420:378-3509(-)|eukprot:CAMPEP_0197864978 /NCGR_PEP_ID=MMETSP1438-20131217/43395_1 /TAXON_ID=1461541 /ORGANISM="Pterosperma sp., Strain CCMP1384" /LENGTH=1043 /DNA_ID=CAMNT_0043483363 /DNA_START=143 /DNA_END=3274 /DNA_ORIENTATION=-